MTSRPPSTPASRAASPLFASLVAGLFLASCGGDGTTESQGYGEAPGSSATPTSGDAPSSAYGEAQAQAPKFQRDPEAVVATVDGKEITMAQVDFHVANLFGPQIANVPREQRGAILLNLQPQAIDELVRFELLLAEAQRRGISVSDEEVQGFLGFAGQTMPEGVTLDQHLASIGMTRAKAEEMARRQGLVTKLGNSLADGIPEASDEDVAAYYKANPEAFDLPEMAVARHILIKNEPGIDDSTKQTNLAKAKALRAQLVAEEPADFSALATQHSDCTSAAEGGNLGQIVRGEKIEVIDDAIFNREVGTIGPIVETDLGFHVIETTEHHPARVVPLEEAAQNIKNQIQMDIWQARLETLVAELQAKAEIVRNDDGQG